MNSRRILGWLLALLVAMGGFTGVGILAAERPAGSVSGVVLDDHGHALAEARVHFMGPVNRTVSTQADGTFRADRLPVGQYNVQASCRGFDSPWSSPAIDLSEDQTVSDLRFGLSPRSPALSFSHHQRVFTPKQTVRLALRGTLIRTVGFKLYRVERAKVVQNFQSLQGLRELDPSRAGDRLVPVKSWTRDLARRADDEDDWFFRGIEVPGPLPEATYLLRVEGQAELQRPGQPSAYSDAYWFEVTHLSLVSKRSGDTCLVYAVDLLTRKPMPGVELVAFDDRQARFRATTDGHGLAKVNFSGYESLLILGEHRGAPAHVGAYYHGGTHSYRTLVYTERPIYRPGQEVCYKAIIRKDDQARHLVPAGLPVTVQLLDPQDNVLSETLTRTNDLGAIDGRIQLSAEPPLGEYRLRASFADDSTTAMFKVEAYRKPEFKLDVQAAQPRIVAGDTAQVTVAASYYFGAPVVGAKLHYNVYSRAYSPFRTEEDDFFTDFSDDQAGWGYSEVVAQGEAETDQAGHARLSLPTHLIRDTQDQTYTVEIEGVDASRLIVRGKGGFLVTRGDYTVEVAPDQYVYRPGETIRARVTARSYDQKPVQADVTTILQRVSWLDRGPDTPSEQQLTEIARSSMRTDAQGEGRLGITLPSQSGDYRLRSESRDANGHLIVSESWLWAADTEWAGQTQRYEMLTMHFDKKRYQVGDVAKVLIQLPSKDVAPLVTLEGQQLYDAFVLEPGQATRLVSIPIKHAYMPNAYVSCVVADGKQFNLAEKSLNLMPDEYFLDVRLSAGQKRYLPGQAATITVETLDKHGKPVAAEVSLGVVDEAVYALAPDRTPDIRHAFHGPRGNRVNTDYSFAEDYSGGPGKDADTPRVRKNFKDTAAWFPGVRTGPSGRATVSFELPDNLTSWVVTARAHNAATQVGANRTKFLATKDLLVRMATPRFMGMGDRAAIATMVHNYTEQAQDVRLSAAAENLKLVGKLPERVRIEPQGVARLDLTVEPTLAATASLTLQAIGQTASDALQLSFPFQPHGRPFKSYWLGRASASGSTELTLAVPPASVPETRRLAVDVMPTPASALIGALNYLRQYPYGCIEQTTSRFVPEMHVAAMLGALGLTLPGAEDRQKRAVDGISRIVKLQKADGGWGWFGDDPSQVELSAYALYGLHEARAAGHDVPRGSVDRAVAFLRAAAQKTGVDLVTPFEVRRRAGPDALAATVWSLASWGQADKATCDRLKTHWDGLSNQGLALAVAGLVQTGETIQARTLWERLKARAETVGEQAHWVSHSANEWYDLDTETTAYALRAALVMEPDSPLVPRAVRWLIAQRQGERWHTTKDTGIVAMALADATRQQAERGLPTEAELLLDARVVRRVELTGQERYWGARFVLDGAELSEGQHRLAVRTPGANQVPMGVSLAYVERAERLEASPNPELAVRRDVWRLDPEQYAKAKRNGGALFFDDKLVASLAKVRGTTRSQDRLLVRVTVEAKRPLRYLVVEDPLPAGAELLDEVSDVASGRQAMDDRMVFFARELATGSTSFDYLLRPELPGRFKVLPPRVEGMYAPELRASGAEDELEIRP